MYITVEEMQGHFSSDYLESRGYSCVFVELDGRRGILCSRDATVSNIPENARVIPIILNDSVRVSPMDNYQRMMMGRPYQSRQTVRRNMQARILKGTSMHPCATYPTWEVVPY